MSNTTDQAAADLNTAITAIIESEPNNNKRYDNARVAMRRLTDGLGEATDETARLNNINRLLAVELGRVKFKQNDGTPAEQAKKPYITNSSLDAAYRRLYKALREVLKEAGYKLKAKANDPTERNLGRVLIEITRDASGEEKKETKPTKKTKDNSANEANLEGAGGEGQDAGDTTLADVSSMDDAGREALAAELVGSMGAASLSRLQEVIEARMTALADENADEAGIDTADMDEGEYDEYDDEAQRLIDALSA